LIIDESNLISDDSQEIIRSIKPPKLPSTAKDNANNVVDTDVAPYILFISYDNLSEIELIEDDKLTAEIDVALEIPTSEVDKLADDLDADVETPISEVDKLDNTVDDDVETLVSDVDKLDVDEEIPTSEVDKLADDLDADVETPTIAVDKLPDDLDADVETPIREVEILEISVDKLYSDDIALFISSFKSVTPTNAVPPVPE
jgi:hypothetical protein